MSSSKGGLPNLPQSDNELRKILDVVRRRQAARVAGDFLPEASAFSVPVFGQGREMKAAITTVGRAETRDIAWDGPVARVLNSYRSRLSGGNPKEQNA